MSVNAFFNAFNATQNALGDPRGDARRRQQEDMQNAMLQREMQMKEYDFSQKQDAYKAQQAEAARIAAADRARFQFRTQRGYGQPQQAPQMAPQPQMQPMQGGAPIEPQAQAIDQASGRPVEQVTVTASQRVPMPSQEDEVTFLLRDAYTRGDEKTFNQLFDMKRQSMSAEELAGRQQIAVVAGQILQLPAEQRGQAVMQALERLGVDPQDVAIDDYVNDPAALEQALRFEMVLGSPDDAMKENIRVQGTFDQFRPFERQDLGNRVGVFDPRTGEFGEGPRIGLSPNTQATVGATIRGQNVSAATQRRGQNMTDARADRTQRTNLPPGFILNGN